MTAVPVAMPAAPNPHQAPPGAASTARRREAAPGEGERRSGGSDFDRTLERAMQRTRRDRPDSPSMTSGRPDADRRPERAEDRDEDTTTKVADPSTDTDDDRIDQRDQHDHHRDDQVPPVTVDAVPTGTAPSATDPTPEPGSVDGAAAEAGSDLPEIDVASTTGATTGSTAATAPVPATGATPAPAGTAGESAAAPDGPAGADVGTTLAATTAARTASGAATSGDLAASVDATASPSVAAGSTDAATNGADPAPAARPIGSAVVTPATAAATVTGETEGAPSTSNTPNAATQVAVTPSAVQSVVAPPTQPPTTGPAPTAVPAAVTAEPAGDPRGVELGDLGSRLGASLRRNERTQTLTIHLHPAELGAITVEARLVDGVTHLHLAPDSATTTERLASSMADLRHQLARAGVDLGDLDLGERRDRSPDDVISGVSRRSEDGTVRRVPEPADRPPTNHRGGLVAIDL